MIVESSARSAPTPGRLGLDRQRARSLQPAHTGASERPAAAAPAQTGALARPAAAAPAQTGALSPFRARRRPETGSAARPFHVGTAETAATRDSSRILSALGTSLSSFARQESVKSLQ